MRTTFKNEKGINKDSAREKMAKAIKNFELTLSLPFEKAFLEKVILKFTKRKMKFIGYEWELPVFKKLVKLIRNEKLPIEANFGSISEAIYQAKENEYGNLLLDYCGVLNTFAKEISFAVTNNIVQKNGIIAVTLSKIGIGNKYGIIGEMSKTIPAKFFKTELKETEHGIIRFFDKTLTSNYRMETVFNYHDIKENGKPGMKMILVIIRRIK
jgi:hypothetical protein